MYGFAVWSPFVFERFSFWIRNFSCKIAIKGTLHGNWTRTAGLYFTSFATENRTIRLAMKTICLNQEYVNIFNSATVQFYKQKINKSYRTRIWLKIPGNRESYFLCQENDNSYFLLIGKRRNCSKDITLQYKKSNVII